MRRHVHANKKYSICLICALTISDVTHGDDFGLLANMRLKIKAASAEGRASAMILTSAPFVALGLIMLISPSFYGDVIDQPVVKWGLAGLGFWIFLGNLIMRRMIDMRL